MANEKRLIDANALVKIAEKRCGVVNIKHIDEQPTVDAVEVVRCKDCKYCDQENLHCDHPMGTAIPVSRKPDDFCSYGERREDNE